MDRTTGMFAPRAPEQQNYRQVAQELSGRGVPGCSSATTCNATRARPAAALVSPLNAFCVTLYNEPCALLMATLKSILRSLRNFHQSSDGRGEHSTICVVIDGAERFDPEAASLLIRTGIIRAGPWQFHEGVDLHFSAHDPSELLRSLGERQTPVDFGTEPVRFIICLKEHNSGKLHSHVLFFGQVCRWLKPKFCYQVDAGTTLCDDTVARMLEGMEKHQQIAAIAPRVMPEIPSSRDCLLQQWQYFDFAFRKSVSWPFEVAAGLLSVIPGQASVFRWRALEGNQEVKGDAPGSGPVDVYLRGAREMTTLERLMYLAEDRVIGMQLVLAEHSSWQLDYLHQAAATTDSCRTLRELLRQRRRWNNSALACRVWLLAQLPRFLVRSDRGLGSKFTFCSAVVAQLILSLREIFAPALLAALVLVLSPATLGETTPQQAWMARAFWAATIADVLLGLMATRKESSNASTSLQSIRMLAAVTASALYVTLVLTFPAPAALVLLAPAIALLSMVLVLPLAVTPMLVRMQFSPVSGLAIFTIVFTYSLFNVHDVSWGTKGLTRPAGEDFANAGLRPLRNLVFPAWIAANILVAIAAVDIPAVSSPSLNVIIEISCLVDGVLACSALCYLLAGYLRRRRE